MTHPPPPSTQRLHALDNLRATMMWLGIVLHVVVIHTSGPPVVPWHDNQTTPVADLLLAFIHAFRMPVFFILAGFFVALLIDQRGPRVMVHNRLRRLALPFALFWPPIFVLCATLATAFVHRMVRGTWGLDPALVRSAGAPPGLSTMHLWFLWMLLWFSLLTPVVQWVLQRLAPQLPTRLGQWFATLASTPWGIALLTLALAGVGMQYGNGLVRASGAFLPPWMEWVHNGLFYALGLALYPHRQRLLAHYAQCWAWYAAAGLVLFLATGVFMKQVPQDTQNLPSGLRLGVALAYNATSWCWSFALIGWFTARFQLPRAWLTYLADGAYWVYLVHMPMTIGFGALMFGLPWPAGVKIVLNIGITTVLCLASYHWLVRSTAIGALLSGKRFARSKPQGVIHAR